MFSVRNAAIAPVGTALTSGTLRRGMEVDPAAFRRSSPPCLFGFMVSRGIKYVIRYTILSLCLFFVFTQACNFLQSMSLNHKIIQFSSFGPSGDARCLLFQRRLFPAINSRVKHYMLFLA